MFCANSTPLGSAEIQNILKSEFDKNVNKLVKRFAGSLELEAKYLETENLADTLAGNIQLPFVGNSHCLELERRRLNKRPNTFPYRLFSITYPGGYFGIRQCIDIDSIRFAIDRALIKKTISREQWDWCVIGLGKVMSRVNNSTGHFAQFLKPTESNLHRIIEKRERSVWDEFIETANEIGPLHHRPWRAKNRAYHSESLQLLQNLKRKSDSPAIIYADPPYSEAQYSRYYHLLDTLVRYHYPRINSIGRYPGDRFQTPFSNKGTVSNSLNELVRLCSEHSAALIFSYPENGLYCRLGGDLSELLSRYYNDVDIIYSAAHRHSTFGGSLAPVSVNVNELIFLANYPKK